MFLFLLLCTALLLVLSVLSYWQIFRMSMDEFFEEWTSMDLGNSGLQIFYALTGLYVFYVLTVMNYARPTFYYGLLTSIDALLFLVIMRRFHQQGTLPSYYRSGFGVYLSGALSIIFLIAALYYLIPHLL